ncbi:NAD(P)-dependent alcohol dehydrogenase [Streptomyces triticirhizae]|uniref:NAD(P)-dependent alcohol dehydrogenase n=1 Tax=Streptomyces triticirhizae TaxID=2483353 RepID=A0A3M2L477_9ACTN|nr:NAD(P)-dependent alcohol dehydrogenase [Streptomyces triticirhizae]RMI32447.1 NAD(P)-dependent alcohol dehydrogenase [Streptomyces triticirhizae]
MTRAAVLRDTAGDFRIEEVTVADELRADEVRVRIVASGVCHTDLLVRDQVLPPPLPAILGHEGSGVVEATGAGVDGCAVGDRVVLAPLSCGRCRNCRSAHPMHCLHWGPLNLRGRRTDGTTAYRDRDGRELNGHFFGQSSFAGHVVTPQRSVIRVRDDLDLTLAGPLGCGLQAGAGAVFNVLAPQPGASIAVFGAGAVGLAGIMAARIAGCDPIYAVDLHPGRLELATELGATHVLEAGDVAGELVRRTGGGVDFALDAVGLPATTRGAVDALAMGGVAAIAGSAGSGQDAPLGLTQLMGRTVHGVIEGDSVPALLIPQLMDLHAAGRFPFEKLVRTYAFDDIAAAVKDSESGETVKPILLH